MCRQQSYFFTEAGVTYTAEANRVDCLTFVTLENATGEARLGMELTRQAATALRDALSAALGEEG